MTEVERSSWRGARVVVLGLARSGEAAARALLARGADVTVLDASDSEIVRARARGLDARSVLGRTNPEDLDGAELVVASPGIAPSSAWMTAAASNAIPVWSEVELAYRLGVRPLVAITGTNGKTTTTEMTVAALLACGVSATAAGNIGHPLVSADGPAIVAEVSSFQLHSIVEFRAPVAVLLNVAADHLDWHGSFEVYAADKARIFEIQTPEDTAVFHSAFSQFASHAAARRVPFDEDAVPAGGAGIQDGWIVVPQGRVVEVSRLQVRGRPGRADATAAAAAACALGMDPERVGEGLAAYRPKPHRTETVAVLDGVTYINDSKATDPHATLAALAELDRVILIAGGRNKALDLGELALAAPRVRAVVAIGESAAEVEAAFASAGVPTERAASMREAVECAHATARAGDTVLLSPACASFDMFVDYEARGEAFRAAVAALGGERV
ncbi:MAG: UDP-N-acetylmuramoyl-L-alanine--D-glutamate ligase [Actinomycetota bacterium]